MTAVSSIFNLVAGALFGSLITVGVLHLQSPGPGQVRGTAPLYPNTVMQNGACTIMQEPPMKVTNPAPEFPHVIATAFNPNYGLHLAVLGRDSKIYHKHQYSPGETGNWSGWKCLTPDFKKVPCSMMPHCSGYDNNPAIAMQPVNGTLIMFVRQMNDLVPHEFHLEDATNPDSWSKARGPSCLCNFPPCAGQTKCGVVSECDNIGVNCAEHPASGDEYYFIGPIFPTSELQLQTDHNGKKLNLFWRGFDGRYYSTTQSKAGDANGKWVTSNGGMLVYSGDNSTIE